MRRKKHEDEDGYSFICAICEDFGELLCCDRCRQGFHLACVGLQNCPKEDLWLCKDCSQNKVRCFDCKEYGYFKKETHRCGIPFCGKIYHDSCIKRWARPRGNKSGIVCPQHYCDICWNVESRHLRNDILYRCLKCPIAYHESCMPDTTGLLEDIPGFMLCFKHGEGWKYPDAGKAPTQSIVEAFDRLPLPSLPQDFKLPISFKGAVRRFLNRPAPYVPIRRNIYLVKRPRKLAQEEPMRCTCSPSNSPNRACQKDCLCGMLYTSCSSSCKCGDACINLPFQRRPGRKMKAVKTEQCGWGLKADENIRAGDFLVEYVGEVIDDEACEKRLWAMKEEGVSNFYMCEISREITIDATFKGNLSRFINHSCSPNCELQKWDIEGEVRIGVFATQDILKGQFVSYDYQFVQFGTDQLCHCGAIDCRGQLGKPQRPLKTSEISSVTSRSRGYLALKPGSGKQVTVKAKSVETIVKSMSHMGVKARSTEQLTVKSRSGKHLVVNSRTNERLSLQSRSGGEGAADSSSDEHMVPTSRFGNQVPVKARSSRKSRPYETFSIIQKYSAVDELFESRRTPVVGNLKVVQAAADVHYQLRGRDSCVGLRVKVWWPLDQKYYHGKIIRYDAKIGKHQVIYDDGQQEHLLMTKEQWEFEKDSSTRKRSWSPPESESGEESNVGVNLVKSPVLERRRCESSAWSSVESTMDNEMHDVSASMKSQALPDQRQSVPQAEDRVGREHPLEWKACRRRSCRVPRQRGVGLLQDTSELPQTMSQPSAVLHNAMQPDDLAQSTSESSGVLQTSSEMLEPHSILQHKPTERIESGLAMS